MMIVGEKGQKRNQRRGAKEEEFENEIERVAVGCVRFGWRVHDFL